MEFNRVLYDNRSNYESVYFWDKFADYLELVWNCTGDQLLLKKTTPEELRNAVTVYRDNLTRERMFGDENGIYFSYGGDEMSTYAIRGVFSVDSVHGTTRFIFEFSKHQIEVNIVPLARLIREKVAFDYHIPQINGVYWELSYRDIFRLTCVKFIKGKEKVYNAVQAARFAEFLTQFVKYL